MLPSGESFRIGGHTIQLFAGDVATLPTNVDALVSSDDNYLSHGGGVSRALWRVAGPELGQFVGKARPQLRLGDVFATPAFNLKARVLWHAITIDLDQNRTVTEADLPNLYLRLFEHVLQEDSRTVGLPLLGAGGAGVSPRASATAFVDALTVGLPVKGSGVTFTLALHRPSDNKSIDIFRDAAAREDDIKRALEQVAAVLPPDRADGLRGAWQQFICGDSDVRAPALALLWEDISDLLRAFPNILDEEVLTVVAREAGLARNRLAHGRTTTRAHDSGTVLAAVRSTLTAVAANAKRIDPRLMSIRGGQADTWDLSAERTDGYPPQATLNLAFDVIGPVQAPSAPPTSSVSRSDRDVPPGRTVPIRELRDFLTKYLPAESLTELYDRLEADGYKGAPEIRLLEFLIRERDLAEFVASEFGNARLKISIRTFRGEDPPRFRTASKLASWFLSSLGFPQPVRPAGLRAVRQAVQAAQAQLLLTNDAALRGAIGGVAQRLEYVCRVMLRFICQAAYRKAPELVLREWGKIGEGETLGRAGLGDLIIFVESLNSHLEKDSSPEVQLFRRDVAKGPLFPPDAGELPSLRNAFSHYRSAESGETLSRKAKEFLGSAARFIDYLARAESRLFPRIVLVDAIHFDTWGRKVIEAVDDEGSREIIFTDDTVSPGETYFMHPLTNPLRVDPILVPAGDLLWLDD